MRFPRFLWPLASLVGALSLGAAEPHPSLPPPVIPDCLGVNIHFTDPKPGEMEMLAAAGFKWVRMDLTWASTERKKGEYDFSAYDRLVAKLDQFKLRAVFILDYGNPLYADPGDKQPFTSRAGTPEFRDAFARWAVAAVSHFKGRGYLWEMWNEPNGGFWKPKADVQQYIALTRATGEALRAANLLGPKSEAFIGPATSTIDLPFLEACFQGGMLEFWDGVSAHPYRQNSPETVVEEYRSVRLLIHKYAPKDKIIPVISGEWGYSSAWTTQGKDEAARQEQQGKYLPRQFLTNIANDVALSIWYDWHDDGTDPKEAEHRFGIVGHEYHAGRDPVYDPKPAYTAMKTLTEQLRGYRFNKELLSLTFLSQQEQHPLLFTKGAEVKIAVWGASNDPRADSLPASPGKFFPVTYLGQALPELEAKGQPSPGLEIKISEAPTYLRAEKPNDLLAVAAAWPRLPLEVMVDPHETKIVRQVIRNPLNHALCLRPEHDNLQTSGPGQDLAPGEEISWQHRYLPSRRESVLAEQLLDLPDGQLHQSTQLLSSAPVRLSPLPLTGKVLHVQVENPTGYALTAKLTLRSVDIPALSNFKSLESLTDGVVFTLAKGEREKIVAVPLKRAPDVRYRVEVLLEEAGRPRVAETIAVRQRIVLDIGDSAHPINYGVAIDGDTKVPATGVVEIGSGHEVPDHIDDTIFTIRYAFGAGWRFLSLSRSEIPWPAIPGTPQSFGLWLMGDAQGAQPRIRFKDSTGQVFQTESPKIDWQGWRFVTFPMKTIGDKQLAHWGGVNDGVIHYPIRWESPFLLDNISRQAVEGEIAISMPTLID